MDYEFTFNDPVTGAIITQKLSQMAKSYKSVGHAFYAFRRRTAKFTGTTLKYVTKFSEIKEENNMKLYIVVTENHIDGVKTLNANVYPTEEEANKQLEFEKLCAKTSFPEWKQIDVDGGFVVAKDINNNGGNFIECRIYEREVKL